MISAIILAHNDEATIAKTLGSLTWCDEIVVIDDNSTDSTVSIAKKFTNKIFERPPGNDFAAQRNFGLTKAKGEWVLFTDSDEVVSPTLASEIERIISVPTKISNDKFQMTNEAVGFYIKRRDIMWGRQLRHGEQGRMKLLRLAKKDAGKWIRPVHEVWEVKGQTAELREPLLHFPHPKVAQYLEKINRYSTLNARYLYRQKVRVSWLQIVAYPVAKFFLNYFLRLGFLDGTAGAVVAIMMSFHSFLTRAKLWKLWHS